MKHSKTTVGILFGGQSAEHEVSLKSAEALYNNLDKDKYSPVFIFLSRKDGLWHFVDETAFVKKDFLNRTLNGHSFLPWLNERKVDQLDVDIYFPMLHGPMGEDGKIQAFLELAGKPYVGANSVSSALAMDKVLAKILFQKAGLNVGEYIFFEENNLENIKKSITEHFPYPVFVKPSAMGSSVGISRVTDEEHLKKAVDLALCYDRKILIEKSIDAREIEVSVMGNDEIKVSRPGELIPHNEFYDYEDKYIDGKTTFHIPANVSPEMENNLRQAAGNAYKALFLNGMARVDLFLEKNTQKIFINEANTIPGFTEISMFPKLWTLQNISFTDLITKLIEYGFQYHQKHRVSTDR